MAWAESTCQIDVTRCVTVEGARVAERDSGSVWYGIDIEIENESLQAVMGTMGLVGVSFGVLCADDDEDGRTVWMGSS